MKTLILTLALYLAFGSSVILAADSVSADEGDALLTVTTEPNNADVRINDIAVGKSPLYGIPLKPGMYRIEVQASPGNAATKEIRLGIDEKRELRFDFVKSVIVAPENTGIREGWFNSKYFWTGFWITTAVVAFTLAIIAYSGMTSDPW